MTLSITAEKIILGIQPFLTTIASPYTLGRVSTKLPNKLNFFAVDKIINTAFKEQISDGDFEFLQGRSLQVEIIDAVLFIGLTYRDDKLFCNHFANSSHQADVTLSIESNDAILLIQQEIDPDTLFFQRKLKINGDTELAHHVKNTIDTLDPEVVPALILKFIKDYQKLVLKP